MGSPAAILQNNPYQSPKYYYPSDLGSKNQSPYCLLDIRESVAKGGGKSKGTIATYLPAEVRSQYHAIYEDTEMGVLGWDPSWNTVGQWGADAKAAISAGKIPGLTDVITGAKSAMSGAWSGAVNAVQATALEASTRLQRDKGMIVNPHMAPLFKGVGFRSFTLSWQFMARNAAESDMIRNIIFTLKYHMLPSIPEGEARSRYMLYPEHFVILFATPKINQMFLVNECVLEDCDVTYNGSGVPAFFRDTGAPVDIRVICQFKEVSIQSKETISLGF